MIWNKKIKLLILVLYLLVGMELILGIGAYRYISKVQQEKIAELETSFKNELTMQIPGGKLIDKTITALQIADSTITIDKLNLSMNELMKLICTLDNFKKGIVSLGTVSIPEVTWIQPGTFSMGSPENERGRGANETLHHVTLSRGYWLGKYEVTQAQYEAVMGTNPSMYKGDNLPVTDVSWEDAMEFCVKLTERVKAAGGELPEGYKYTLPTEAQWEYACRAGTEGKYNVDDVDLSNLAWCASNSQGEIHSVGQKQPNAWGLYDMHGNVYEWCLDSCDLSDVSGDVYGVGVVTDTYKEGIKDPFCTMGTDKCVYRGGCLNSEPNSCRSAFRNWSYRNKGDNSVGFRLALVPVQ